MATNPYGRTGIKFMDKNSGMLTDNELIKYDRHILLSEIGMEGQERLKAGKVLVIGAGGLGCPMLQYLAAAGVGTIGIIDFDVIEATNLQRQILYSEDDIGKNKVAVATKKIQALNPLIDIIPHHEKLTSENAISIIKDYDIIADGTDNFATRYLVNDACVTLEKVLVFGSIFKFEGQVTVFNCPPNKDSNAGGPTYRCLFPTPPPPDQVPNCGEAGVLGVLPGIVGSIQANEIIKLIIGVGTPLAGKLLLIDAKTMETNTITFSKNADEILKIKQLGGDLSKTDYEVFCKANDNTMVKEITPKELLEKIEQDEPFQLIDVRESFEYRLSNMKGELIPMRKVKDNIDKIAKDKPVVIHCRSGQRSAMVIQQLQDAHGFTNLYNLKGGIKAWLKESKE